MRRKFRTIRDYHRNAPDILVEHVDFTSLRASVLTERSGDVQFTKTERNGLVLTLDGTSAHLTRMDTLNDEKPSHPGEVCLIPSGIELHLAWTNHTLLQKSLMLEFDHTIFAAYAPEVLTDVFARGHMLPANFGSRPELGYLVRLISREIDGMERRGRIFAESAIRLFAIEIAASAWSTPTRPIAGRTKFDTRVHRAIEYIEMHFASDISLLEIARAAGLSPTRLTNVFRHQTGSTPYSYVIDRRLRHAIQLLRTSDMPIAQVALDAGFSDQQHLTRIFRTRLLRTPKEVRQE